MIIKNARCNVTMLGILWNSKYGQAIRRAWYWIGGSIAIVLFVAWLIEKYKFEFLDIVSLFIAIGIGILVLLALMVGSHLTKIEEKIDRALERQSNPKNPSNPGNPDSQAVPEHEPRIPSESEPEQRPTGAGALAGMIVGGTLGAAGGPVGVIVGGVIGAFVGNQVEFNNIRRRSDQ